MELKNRTLSNFAELVETGECKKFRGRLKTGIDLGTANTVLAVVDRNNRPIAGISAPSHAIQDGVIVNYYESVQLVTKLKNELEEKLGTELTYGAAAIPPGVSEGSVKSIGYVLEGAGFMVETAGDGVVAVKKMEQAVPGQYDLILMDIQMPVMNGYEAAKQIRSLKNRETASVPIVAMTANAFEEDREKSYEAGMNGYLAKPVSAEALINTIDKIMKDN